MDKEEDNKTTEPVYPEPLKGPLSDDHSNYGAPKQWAGGNPDKNMRYYFVGFLVVIGLLFVVAVKSLSGADFFF
ncbi:hypothetical protein H0X10_02490 [Candidatus Saccharibacteria bacterium]|nr:hypothetical protein [Candidatus Saccharibacteria bacterium]